MYDKLKPGLFKTLQILDEYLPEIVLGGGWVPLIYFHYVLGDKSLYTILTADIDFMVNNKLPEKEKSIDSLLKEAGLNEKCLGAANKPVVHYVGNIDDNDITVEFLTDLKGAGDKQIISVQKGLNAEALRYLSLSIDNSIIVEIDDAEKFGLQNNIKIRVPTPGAFVFHKGLVFTLRKENAKKEKDLYYIFNLLSTMKLQQRIIDEIIDLRNNYDSWFKTFLKNMTDYFTVIKDESVGAGGGMGGSIDGASESRGVLAVVNQKPVHQFVEMEKEQFMNYVYLTFESFIDKIK